MEGILIPLITWLIGVAALLLFLYLMSRHNLWIRKYGLTLFLAFWFLGFTIYFIGYFFGSEISGHRLFHAASSLFSAIFSSGRMMTMEIDLKETGRLAAYGPYQAACVTIILSSMLLLAATLLANIGGGVIGRIRLIFLKTIGTRQNIYLIYGLRRESVYLAGDIHRKNPKATVLLLHDRNEDTAQEESRKILENDFFQYGAAKISFSSEKPLPFLARIVHKCRKQTFLILMDSACRKNTSLLEKLDLPSIEKAMPKLHIYVLYEKEINECIAQESVFQKWDIHWISYGDLAARQALTMPSFLDICPEGCSRGRAEGELKLAIVGYSDTAEELCRYLSSCVQIAGMKVSLLLFDKEIQQKTACFRFSSPELSKAVSLVLSDIEPDSLEFYEFFEKNQNALNAVFFAGKEERKNILCAFRLRKLLQSHPGKNSLPFFVQKASIQEDRQAFELSGLQSFGCMEQIYSYDTLINEELDIIAKAVHWHYHMYKGTHEDMELLWREASLYDKMSSRALAIHIPWKLKCADFQKVPGKADGAYEQELERDPALMENLSIGEHLRWNAFLFAEGWKTAAPEELPPGQRKDNGRKLHACLVSWEDLIKIGGHYHEDFQYLDRHFIKSLGQILQCAGYAIQKTKESEEM